MKTVGKRGRPAPSTLPVQGNIRGTIKDETGTGPPQINFGYRARSIIGAPQAFATWGNDTNCIEVFTYIPD